MGAGRNYSLALATRGEKICVVTRRDIKRWTRKARKILSELKERGVKFSREKIIFAIKTGNMRPVFLETGTASAGLKHIKKRHGGDFDRAFKIGKHQIGDFLQKVMSKWKLVKSVRTFANGKAGYQNTYYSKGNYAVMVRISDNGYIVSAHPRDVKELKNKEN